jgi:cell division protein FtsQ
VSRFARRLLAGLALLVALLGGGWLWLKDSSLVAVRQVSVIGLSGQEAPQIRAALVARARTMTTLDVREGDLRAAVAPYPVVRALRVTTQFPHGIRIWVSEQIPVGAVLLGARAVPVASDGKILHDLSAAGRLPLIVLPVPPAGSELTDQAGRAALAVLASAPWQMLPRLARIRPTARHGLVVQVRRGPALYFGPPSDLAAKWAAADTVLADARSQGALYIDVTDPARPAAGSGLSPRAVLNGG